VTAIIASVWTNLIQSYLATQVLGMRELL
jgi:hypothetical protein